AAGITDDDPLEVAIEKLRESCESEEIADLLGLASGVLEAVKGERSQQEIAWAAREWVDRLGRDAPLVLAFEDIHWAEEALLDLIEHLAEWVRDAPLLILTLARTELLDVRPGAGGRDRQDLLGRCDRRAGPGAGGDRRDARRAPAPRVHRAGGAFDDLRRDRLPVQARPDPRGRLFRAVQVCARRPARAVR